MKSQPNTILLTLCFALILLLQGCSDGKDDETQTRGEGDHVWKSQTDALKKAEQVDQLLQDSANAQRQTIDEQTQ
jgi:hypothetical protein